MVYKNLNSCQIPNHSPIQKALQLWFLRPPILKRSCFLRISKKTNMGGSRGWHKQLLRWLRGTKKSLGNRLKRVVPGDVGMDNGKRTTVTLPDLVAWRLNMDQREVILDSAVKHLLMFQFLEDTTTMTWDTDSFLIKSQWCIILNAYIYFLFVSLYLCLHITYSYVFLSPLCSVLIHLWAILTYLGSYCLHITTAWCHEFFLSMVVSQSKSRGLSVDFPIFWTNFIAGKWNDGSGCTSTRITWVE